MNTARSSCRRERSSIMSVTGPQNLLMQNAGVANTTSAGRPSAIARAIVHRWSSGSGIVPVLAARESIAAGGTLFEWTVRFSVGWARSPGAGSEGCSCTANVACAVWEPRPGPSGGARGMLLHGERGWSRLRAESLHVRGDLGHPDPRGIERHAGRLVDAASLVRVGHAGACRARLRAA